MKTSNLLRHLSSRVLFALLLTPALGSIPTQVAAQAPDRSAPPELGPPPVLSLPPLQEDCLANGLRIFLMEKHDIPVVQVNFTVFSGADREIPGKYGLASMTADMMDEGAGGRSALELADALEFLGVRFRISSSDHTLGASLYTPVSKLEEALPLVADILLHPDFPEEELERKRRSALTGLLQAHDQPTTIAVALFAEGLYGIEHPYGRAGLLDEASIRGITVADMRVYHQTHVRPNNAAVVVVGDLTMEEAKARLESLFGDWDPGEVPEATLPPSTQVEATRILLVNKPEAPQSVIRMGRIGAPRNTEDYEAIGVMNTVLGGSFTSRLNQNLREDKGFTYGAGSRFAFQESAGPFSASSSVQTEVTGAALTEFFREMEGIRDPIPREELERAKNYDALGYPAAFGSGAGIASQLNQMVLYDLPRDSFNQYVGKVLAVTQEQAQAAARKYVVPGAMLVVIVGDAEKIEAEVRALELGPLTILSVEDVLGPLPELGGLE